MMKVKHDGANQRVFLKIAHASEDIKKGIRHGFFRFAADLQDTANREILRKPKSGRVYIVRGPSGRRRRHVASAPGETHANLTGKTRRSMGWKVYGGERMEFGYGLGKEPAPEYAEILEKTRPSLRNAVDARLRNAEVHFAREIKRRFAL